MDCRAQVPGRGGNDFRAVAEDIQRCGMLERSILPLFQQQSLHRAQLFRTLSSAGEQVSGQYIYRDGMLDNAYEELEYVLRCTRLQAQTARAGRALLRLASACAGEIGATRTEGVSEEKTSLPRFLCRMVKDLHTDRGWGDILDDEHNTLPTLWRHEDGCDAMLRMDDRMTEHLLHGKRMASLLVAANVADSALVELKLNTCGNMNIHADLKRKHAATVSGRRPDDYWTR